MVTNLEELRAASSAASAAAKAAYINTYAAYIAELMKTKENSNDN